MSTLHVGMVGFDITPRFHPQYGAWGTTPTVTELDMPLLSRCVAIKQDDRRFDFMIFVATAKTQAR